MNPKYRFNVAVFHEPPGGVYELRPGTYALTICDICGKKRKCDFLVPEVPTKFRSLVGFDCCRSCRKEHGTLIED